MDHEAIAEWREEINRTGNTLADDILGQLIVTEDALLAERERAGKLRAAMELYANQASWEQWHGQLRGDEEVYEGDAWVWCDYRDPWEIAQQALREDGEAGGFQDG